MISIIISTIKTTTTIITIENVWMLNLRQYPLLLAMAIIISAVCSNASYSQTLSTPKIQTSYIYKFIQNIEWENQERLSSFKIAIYNEKDMAITNELAKLSRKNKQGIPIRVSKIRNISSVKDYQLVYIGEANDSIINRIYKTMGNRPILIVTKNYANKRLVMINLFQSGNKLLFEVNKANIINQDLKPLPALILNGGTEIDVAKLYKQGQNSLKTLQDSLGKKELALAQLTKDIQKQQRANTKLIKNLQNIEASINKSNQIIAQQKNEMDAQQLEILQQKTEIDNSKAERQALLLEVQHRNTELNDQEKRLAQRKKELDAISANITEKENQVVQLSNVINSQKQNIAQQEQNIASQQEEIFSLDEQVASQQKTLQYLWVIIGLGTALFFSILVAYTLIRRNNKRLEEKTHQLQLARDRLAIAKTKADNASQAKSDFLSIMTHELRTPLQAIIGYTDVVLEDMELEGYAEYQSDLQRVINNAQRLLRLINRILDLAKIESGKMEINLHPIQLSSVVDEAISTIRPLIDKNNNKLLLNVSNGDTPAPIDHDKILHILINLLANAAKFTHEGTITVQAAQLEEKIIIKVQDTGIGLTKEEQQKVFDRFHQAETGEARKFQGSGLGLSITKQFCELMGGSITLKSKRGAGTMFTITIPLPITMPEKFIQAEDNDEILDTAV